MESSGLAFIEVKNPKNPFDLFKEWFEEVTQFMLKPKVMNLATASRNGNVSSRNVLLRDLLDDGGLIVLTCKSKNTRKFKDISENPQVAVSFVWTYQQKDGKIVDRQVRFEGIAEALPDEITQTYYSPEPLHCKIRSRLCRQGEKVDWNDLKTKHDVLLKNAREGNISLAQLNDDQIGYKIVPKKVDFYYAYDTYIGDRVVFENISNGDWNSYHVAA